jgi:hypothetical protein
VEEEFVKTSKLVLENLQENHRTNRSISGNQFIYLMHLLCFQVTIDNMDGHSIPNSNLTTPEGIKKWQATI